jgi:hypothetical protein
MIGPYFARPPQWGWHELTTADVLALDLDRPVSSLRLTCGATGSELLGVWLEIDLFWAALNRVRAADQEAASPWRKLA